MSPQPEAAVPASIQSWVMVAPGAPLERRTRAFDPAVLETDRALVRVAGCGVCHTDLGFYYEGVPTGTKPPLTLGHEVSGIVVAAPPAWSSLVGQAVVVPAVTPCGDCPACRDGLGSICSRQVFLGSDVDGGFASHVVAPARGLCPVDMNRLATAGLDLPDLAVVADAVTTPYQAVLRAGLRAGDLAVVVGVGGVGGYAVQIAAALGAHVAAIDVDARRLEAVAGCGAGLVLDASATDPKALRKSVRDYAASRGVGPGRWRIFECSGRTAGQDTAFGLINHGAVLLVVGYSPDKLNLHLSRLMAFHAEAKGNWGCLPEHYPAAVDLVLEGKVKVQPFIERRPMSRIAETFRELHEGTLKRRPVLVPDFE